MACGRGKKHVGSRIFDRGKVSTACTDPEARQKSYSALFQDELSNKDIERIRTYSQIGKALGSEQFKTRLYEALGSESRL